MFRRSLIIISGCRWVNEIANVNRLQCHRQRTEAENYTRYRGLHFKDWRVFGSKNRGKNSCKKTRIFQPLAVKQHHRLTRMKMKIALLTFVFLLLLALSCGAFQVTSPKLVFGPDETGLGIQPPSGGQYDDYIISSCRQTVLGGGKSTPLYKKKVDGAYEMLLLPELQVCPYNYRCAATNGKWVFVAGYNSTSPTSSFYSFYSFGNESNLILTTRLDDPDTDITYCRYAKFISENTLMTFIWSNFVTTMVEWNYDGGSWNQTYSQAIDTFDFYNTTELTSTSFDPVTSNIASYTGENGPLFSKQANEEWGVSAFFGGDDYESYEKYVLESAVHFNGNNTVIYLGGSRAKWSSGTIYIAEYQKNNQTWHVVKKFNSEDVGLDNEYTNIYTSWVSSAVWINQDMAFLMAPNYPFNYNETDWTYGGSVVMMYRDKAGQWQMGGRISIVDDDGTGEAVQLKDLTRTKNDIIITGIVSNTYSVTSKYLLYSYPLCFPNKLNFTCHKNVSVTSCNEADFVVPTDAYSYIDDGCGEPFATVKQFEILNGTAIVDVKFERLGFEVGNCTTTFACPPPPPPIPEPVASPQKTGQVSGPGADRSSLVAYLATLVLSAIALLAL